MYQERRHYNPCRLKSELMLEELMRTQTRSVQMDQFNSALLAALEKSRWLSMMKMKGPSKLGPGSFRISTSVETLLRN